MLRVKINGVFKATSRALSYEPILVRRSVGLSVGRSVGVQLDFLAVFIKFHTTNIYYYVSAY